MRLDLSVVLTSMATAKPLGVAKMHNLVSFGNSFTDESRRDYFVSHDDNVHPPGAMLLPSESTASGGQAVGRFVAQQTVASIITTYAVSGAACSNEINTRWSEDINQLDSSTSDCEILAYVVDIAFEDLYLYRPFEQHLVHRLDWDKRPWGEGFLTDSQVTEKFCLLMRSVSGKCLTASTGQVVHISLYWTFAPFWKFPLYRLLERVAQQDRVWRVQTLGESTPSNFGSESDVPSRP